MSRTSRRVRRFEKEAILRVKEYEYRREQSDNLLTTLHQNPDDEDSEQHRRHLLMRRIQQILRDENNPVESTDKSSDYKASELNNRTVTDRSYRTVASSTSTVSNDRREHRDNSTSQNPIISKYTNITKTH